MRAFVFFLIFIACVFAVSESFTLTLKTDKKVLKKLLIQAKDDSIFIGDVSIGGSSVSGAILDDGTVKVSGNSFIGISKNYLTITDSYKMYASPFGINKDGYLTLYDSKDFKVLPSGTGGQYVVGSKYATSSEEIYTVNIKCIKSNGKSAGKFEIKSSGAGKSIEKPFIFALFFVVLLGLFNSS